MIAWPPEASPGGAFGPRTGTGGSWQLGPGEAGRVRARLEVSPGAELIVRRGGNVVRIPVAAILERPQHTPPQTPLAVSVERLPWDSLMIELGQGAESGVVAPSTLVPLVRQVQHPLARCRRRQRAVHGRSQADERRLSRSGARRSGRSLPANRLDPPAQIWSVPSPKAEGTYVLELHATWEPAGARDGSRLGRLIRRRKPVPVPSSATRRVVFAVVSPRDPVAQGGSTAVSDNPGRETEVDSLDLSRIRNTRFTASGRSPGLKPGRNVWALPTDVLVDASRKERDHDRLRSWITRSVSEAADLGPADDTGLAWSVVGLRLSHPDRPHRLTVTVVGGDPSALGVAVVDPGGAGQRCRVLLDACASGPPILKEGPPVTFSWLVWPDTAEPLLVLLNRNTSGSVRLGTVKLIRARVLAFPSDQPEFRPLPPRGPWACIWQSQSSLDRFGGRGETGLTDALEVARNLASYLTYCGASLVVLPERLSDRHVSPGAPGPGR